jgi:hypothetical protein
MTLRDAHRPTAPAELRNDQCQARELQERAILLALQCDVVKITRKSAGAARHM